MVKSSLPVFAGVLLLSSLSAPMMVTGARVVPIEKMFSREERQLPNEEFLNRIRASTPSPDRTVPPDFECGWRPLAYKYAQQLQPYLTASQFQAIHDGLELTTLCNITFDGTGLPLSSSPSATLSLPSFATEEGASTLYVDPVNGNDNNPGTQGQPLQHVATALRLSRALPPPATIILREGVHRLTSTLEFSTADNGLTLMGYPGENAVVSGGTVFTPNWTPYNVTPVDNNFTLYPNIDAMYDDYPDPNVVDLGPADSYIACQTLCTNYAVRPCNAWVWYDSTNIAPWGNECYGRTDTNFIMTEQNHTWSGRRSSPMNIYVTDLTLPSWVTNTDEFVLSLMYSADNGATPMRATRARYPNANPELDLYPTGWSNAGTYQPGVPNLQTTVIYSNLTGVNYPGPGLNPTMFTDFYWGEGGPCERFTPQGSYWCQPYGRTAGATYFINSPVGFNATDNAIPNLPFTSDVVGNGAIFNAWRHGHWFSLMHRVNGYSPTDNSFSFGYGAFQGAEGESTNEAWYLENVMELLDAPNEFFYDAAAGKLYYFYNGTTGSPPPSSWTWETPLLQTLISIQGDTSLPVTGITISGITFTSAAPTYLSPHGTPSGGDWGLARIGAILLENTESITISNNLFSRLDGNAVFISGYNRNATVYRNEFVWIGDSAIASWGYTVDVDATAGTQPWYNNITQNLCHEIGHFEKQSSCYFQATTALSWVEGNIFYNGPRAMVNFNDGLPPGGSTLYRNLVWNTCRESQDHGPFNSWDRVPYLGYVDGTVSVYMKFYEVSFNFFVANYGADGSCLDTDDGSSRFYTHDNFWVYGGEKSDFDGHQKVAYNNLMAFANVYGPRCLGIGMPVKGVDSNGVPFDEGFYNNTCILESAGLEYLSIGGCSTDPTKYAVITHDNKIYAPNASVVVSCGSTLSFAQWEATGLDPGTTVNDLPDTPTIIGWAADLLSIPQ